jgi:hypothetical protein
VVHGGSSLEVNETELGKAREPPTGHAGLPNAATAGYEAVSAYRTMKAAAARAGIEVIVKPV